VLAREVHVAERTSTELLGAGDLLRPWELDDEDPVPCAVVWRVLEPADLALLDAFFADRIRPWPQLGADLMASAVRRAHSLAVLRAIACHPRVDMRVAMLLWHLAGRWGKVGSDGGVRLTVPLTHRLIGELVGAERPSVSHALSRLAATHLVVRADDGWHLYGTPDDAAAAAARPLAPH
jgi:CRP-like cAMP-binding protein